MVIFCIDVRLPIDFTQKSAVINTALFLFLIVVHAQNADAAAWPQEKGKGQTLQTITFYTNNVFVDQNGNRKDQEHFTKWEFLPTIEYGMTDSLTIGGQSSFINAAQSGKGKTSAFSDIKLYVRKAIFQNNNAVISMQPGIKLPGIYDNKLVGKKTTDIEFRLLAGKTFLWNGLYHFTNLELAYNARMQHTSDEIKCDISGGFSISRQWAVLMQSFSTFALNQRYDNTLSKVEPDGFDLSKVQFSGVYKFSEKTSFQIGVVKDIWARNTGIGHGMMTSLWINF